MNWSDVGSKIAQYAPIAGAALSSPFGAVTAVGSLIASAFGVKSTPEDVARFIDLNPERAADLLKVEMANNLDLQKLCLAREQEITKREEELTKRLQADMQSGSWLPKNIRPLMLVYIVSVYTLFAFLSAFKIDVNQSYVELLSEWGKTIMSFYFVGRTAEKMLEVWNSKK